MKYIIHDVNGYDFEIVRGNKARAIINGYKNGKEWYELYKKPSTTKENIRRHWAEFFGDFVNKKYRGNCNTFSIFVQCLDDRCQPTGTYFYITKSHQYVAFEWDA